MTDEKIKEQIKLPLPASVSLNLVDNRCKEVILCISIPYVDSRRRKDSPSSNSLLCNLPCCRHFCVQSGHNDWSPLDGACVSRHVCSGSRRLYQGFVTDLHPERLGLMYQLCSVNVYTEHQSSTTSRHMLTAECEATGGRRIQC